MKDWDEMHEEVQPITWLQFAGAVGIAALFAMLVGSFIIWLVWS